MFSEQHKDHLQVIGTLIMEEMVFMKGNNYLRDHDGVIPVIPQENSGRLHQSSNTDTSMRNVPQRERAADEGQHPVEVQKEPGFSKHVP